MKTLTNSDYEKACLFSEQFSSVFIKDNGILPHFQPNCNSNLCTFTCSVNDVIKIVKSLKNDSSSGLDNFTPFFLKNILAYIANPLNKLFNVSLDEGKIPEDWKKASIIPIFKKGDRQNVKNYRPVSLTSTICKILERIIREQLMKYLLDNNIIPSEQHGFMPKKSTMTNLIECMDSWTKNFDIGVQTDVLYLDYSKCFDSVSHTKLIFKLSRYGISGSALKWFESFLLGRNQCVKINSALSPMSGVISGVPQGSVLGPILYLCFSADAKSVISHCEFKVYADDTKLFKAIMSFDDCNLLQQDLDAIAQWSTAWQLKLNPDKTKCLSLGNVKFPHNYLLYNNSIDLVHSMSDLGVIVRSDLKFTQHCSMITRKAYFSIKGLFNTFKGHDSHFYVFMYYCYIRPMLESSSPAWSPILKGNIDLLERVQRYFTKRLPGFNHLSYAERLFVLKMDSLEHRRARADIILFYKLISGDVIVDLYNPYQFVFSYRGHCKTLFKFQCRTERRRYFWLNRITNFWNKLPQNAVSANSIDVFKSILTDVIFNGRGSMYCF